MLILSRKPGERLCIDLAEGVSGTTTVGELFRGGPIEVTVTRVHCGAVRLGIRADRRFLILREELRRAQKADQIQSLPA